MQMVYYFWIITRSGILYKGSLVSKLKMEVIKKIIQGIINETPDILQQLSKLDKKQQQQIIQAIAQLAQQGDQNAIKAIQKLQGSTKAKLGAKLNYIKRLKGECPEGQELVYMKRGGRMCPVCVNKKGKKLNKKKSC